LQDGKYQESDDNNIPQKDFGKLEGSYFDDQSIAKQHGKNNVYKMVPVRRRFSAERELVQTINGKCNYNQQPISGFLSIPLRISISTNHSRKDTYQQFANMEIHRR